MKHLLLAGALALATTACGGGADTTNEATPAGNAASAEQPSGTIAEGLGNSRLTTAIKAAGLEATLRGAGPYTLLAPSDEAFAKLPKERLDALLKPEGKEDLTRLLTGHVLPGTMLAGDINKAIDAGKGKAVLVSMAGDTLTATREGDRLVLTSKDGARAIVSGSEQVYGNGVVHPIDTVLVPAS